MILLADEENQNRSVIELLQKQHQITEDFIRQDSLFSYPSLLKEIASRIPAALQVTSLGISNEGIVSLHGKALSFQTIHEFAALLEQSQQIKTAKVNESRVSTASSRIFEYHILCQINITDTGDKPDDFSAAD